MSLKIIKSKLEKMGYYCYLYEEEKEFAVGTITGTIPEINANQVKVYCKIISTKEAFIVEFFVGQLVRNKHFSTTTQVVNYVQTTYPLP